MNRRGHIHCGAPAKRPICSRPKGAVNRTERGHLEGDTVHSRKGLKGGVLTIRDHKNRMHWFLIITKISNYFQVYNYISWHILCMHCVRMYKSSDGVKYYEKVSICLHIDYTFIYTRTLLCLRC